MTSTDKSLEETKNLIQKHGLTQQIAEHHTAFHSSPHPHWEGEKNWGKKQKVELVGWDKAIY